MSDLGAMFLDQSRRYLREEYLVKIDACLDRLSGDQLWWRPNERTNSVGNLTLHLAGNIRQWIVAGIGGAADTRQRQAEFDERGPIPGADLHGRLHAAVMEADAVLTALDPAVLPQVRHIQGRDVTILGAVYHVVEHFGMHTGQIAYLTKQLLDTDLSFYRPDGARRPWW